MRDDPINGLERIARSLNRPIVGRVAVRLLHLLGVDIPRNITGIETVRLPHWSAGLVVHPNTVLGNSVTLMQGVTIGRSDQFLDRSQLASGGGVVLDENVYVGAGAVVLFRSGETLTVGKRSLIGANSVVTRSIPAGEIWAGNPARKIRDLPEDAHIRIS